MFFKGSALAVVAIGTVALVSCRSDLFSRAAKKGSAAIAAHQEERVEGENPLKAAGQERNCAAGQLASPLPAVLRMANEVDISAGRYRYSGQIASILNDATPETLCIGRTGTDMPESGFQFAFWSGTCQSSRRQASDLILLQKQLICHDTVEAGHQRTEIYTYDLVADFGSGPVVVGRGVHKESWTASGQFYQDSLTLEALCSGNYENACMLRFTHGDGVLAMHLGAPEGGAGGVVTDQGSRTVNNDFYSSGSEFHFAVDNGTVANICSGRTMESGSRSDFRVGVWARPVCTRDKLPESKVIVLEKRLLEEQQAESAPYTIITSVYELSLPSSGIVVGTAEVQDSIQPHARQPFLYHSQMKVLELCTGRYANACGLQFAHEGDELSHLEILPEGSGVVTDRQAVTVRSPFNMAHTVIPASIQSAARSTLCLRRANVDNQGFGGFTLWWGQYGDASWDSCAFVEKVPKEKTLVLAHQPAQAPVTAETAGENRVERFEWSLTMHEPDGPVIVGELQEERSYLADGDPYIETLRIVNLCSGPYERVCQLTYEHDENGNLRNMRVILN